VTATKIPLFFSYIRLWYLITPWNLFKTALLSFHCYLLLLLTAIELPSLTVPISHLLLLNLLLLKPREELPHCLSNEKLWSECAASVDGNFESCVSTPGCGQPVMDNPNNRSRHPGRPYHPESLHGSPAPSWIPPEHNHLSGPQSQAYLVQNHASQPRPHHSLGRGSASLDSYQMGLSGGPLLPNPLSQPFTLPHPSGGLYLPHQGHWTSHSMQAPIPPNYSGMMNMSGGLRYELMPALPAVGSGYPLQTPESNPGMGLHANPGLEANTPAQNRYISVPYYVGPPPMHHQRESIGLDPLPATSNRRLALSRAARSQSFYSPSCK
jgi:hypothetical protein